jgi:putative transposase
MSMVASLFHIIIVTHRREKVLIEESRKELYYYIWGIIKKHNCKLIRMNGMEDHLHILLELHPTVPLSDLVRDIKRSSSLWIKENKKIPLFKGWSEGYAAFACSFEIKEKVKTYIINQQLHHMQETLENEYCRLAMKNGLTPYEKKE